MSQHLHTITKTEAAYRALRDAIEDGTLAPGARIRLTEFQSKFALSPTPIREALRLLEAHGLVEHAPHRGVTVTAYVQDNVDEVYRLRLVLEHSATELAVNRMTPETLRAIRSIYDHHVEVVNNGLPTEAPALNAAWHRAIYTASGSALLQEFIGRLWARLPVEALWSQSRASQALEEHADVMEAITRGDAPLAAELMRKHIESGARARGIKARHEQVPLGD
jgi:DNA-binding GntR family transcriptional regulator